MKYITKKLFPPECFGARSIKGFTLIELLVVVLIIGILAAVAFPQYQKVLEKARGAAVIALLKSLGAAQDRYFLENGTYATTFAQLDTPLPAEWDQSCNFYSYSSACHSNGTWGIAISTSMNLKGTIYLEKLTGPYQGTGFFYMPSRKVLGINRSTIQGLGCLEQHDLFQKDLGSYCASIWKMRIVDKGMENMYFFQ